MIELPPGEPDVNKNSPFGLKTITGAIDDLGRLFGPTALATKRPSESLG